MHPILYIHKRYQCDILSLKKFNVSLPWCRQYLKSTINHLGLHCSDDIGCYFAPYYRAINEENKEMNTVKNQLTGEYGAVPDTARYYKVRQPTITTKK